MFAFLIVIIAIIAVLLTLVVLLQSGKGGGLAGIASGGATTQILGSRQTPDFLEKATWTLATAFIILCIMSNFVISDDQGGGSVIQQQGQTGQLGAPVLPSPGTEAPATDTPATDTPAKPDGNGQ